MAGRALHSVEYIFNPRLVKAFERQKKLYDLAYGEKGHSQILLFHSTPAHYFFRLKLHVVNLTFAQARQRKTLCAPL